MTDCECLTVKYYDDKQGWFCMMCFKPFKPAEEVTRVTCKTGCWVFKPFDEPDTSL